MTANELEAFLHEKIPISRFLGVSVSEIRDEDVTLRSPLTPNINHLGTAFGGSLAAIGILAGYAWVHHSLSQLGHDVHIILKNSEIKYLHPVDEDFVVKCAAPDKIKFETFLKAYEKKGLARIDLFPRIETAAGVACKLRGEFVGTRTRV